MQEMFGAVLLFCAEIRTIFLCAMESKKNNDEIIIRDMSKRGEEVTVSGTILYNALGVMHKSMLLI